MASTPTTRNRFNKQGVGDNSGTWGTVLNEQDFDLIDEALDGYESIAVAANVTLTSTNYASDQARNRVLKFTGAGGFNVTIPGVEKWYVIHNACTAAVTVKTAGGAGASVPASAVTFVYCDGTDCTAATNTGSSTFTQALTARIDNAANASVTQALKVSHTTTGTPATGIGVGIEFEAETSASNNEVGATIEAVTTDATAASEDFKLVFKTMAAGAAAASRAELDSTGLTASVPLIAPAATTSIPSARMPHGTAPTAPTNGDVWTTTAGVYARVNGATVPLRTRAMQVLAAGSQGPGVTVYMATHGSGTVEANFTFRMPYAATLRNLYTYASANAAAGETFTYTLRKNSVDTALAVSVTGATGSGQDTTNTVSFAAGDQISVKLVTSAGAATATHNVSFEIEPA